MLTLYYLSILSPCVTCVLLVLSARLANGTLKPGSKTFYSELRMGFVAFSHYMIYIFVMMLVPYHSLACRNGKCRI